MKPEEILAELDKIVTIEDGICFFRRHKYEKLRQMIKNIEL